MHRAGHPELRLEQILCVLPRLQAPPQLLQLRLLQRDAVPQVLDLRLRGLQLALLARRPKLLLQLFSHAAGQTQRNALNASTSADLLAGGVQPAGISRVFYALVSSYTKSAGCLPSSSCSPVDEEGRSEQCGKLIDFTQATIKYLFVLLSPINESSRLRQIGQIKLGHPNHTNISEVCFRNPEGTIIHTRQPRTMLALLATVPNAFAGFATVRRSQLVL